MEKKILIAIDGSIYSNNSLSYVASIFSKCEDVHFHLLTCIRSSTALPESTDSNNSLFPQSLSHQKLIGTAKSRLKKGTDKLSSQGINTNRITSSAVSFGSSIGTAVQHEAEKLLADAIIVGRRGIGRVGEMLMGSTSATLFKRSHSIPLWIIDGEIESKKILVPIDRTLHSLMAIDHLAHIFADRNDINLYLFHCHKLFGNKKKDIDENQYKKWADRWRHSLEEGADFLLHGPAQILIDAGINEENIEILPKATDLEESLSIIRKASTLDCGTIVMGRRGVGMAKGLFGGVSERTLKKTENMALWVVG